MSIILQRKLPLSLLPRLFFFSFLSCWLPALAFAQASAAPIQPQFAIVPCASTGAGYCGSFADRSGVARQVYLTDDRSTLQASGPMGTQTVNGRQAELAYLYASSLLPAPATGLIAKESAPVTTADYASLWVLDLTTAKLVAWVSGKYVAQTEAYGFSNTYFDVVHGPGGKLYPFIAPGIHYRNAPYWNYLCIFDAAYIAKPSRECEVGFKPYSVDFTPILGQKLPGIPRLNGGWVEDLDGDGWDDINLPMYSGYILTLSGKSGQQLGLSHFDPADPGNTTLNNPPGHGGYFHGGRTYGAYTAFTDPATGAKDELLAAANPVGTFGDEDCVVSRYFLLLRWRSDQWQPLWSDYLGFVKTVFKGPSKNSDRTPIPYSATSTQVWRTGDDLNNCDHRFSDSLVWLNRVPYIVYDLFNEQNTAPMCQQPLYDEHVVNGGFAEADSWSICARTILLSPGTWSVHILNALTGREVGAIPQLYVWGRADNLMPQGQTLYLVQQFDASRAGVVPFRWTASGSNGSSLALTTIRDTGSGPQLSIVATLPSGQYSPPAIAETGATSGPIPLPAGDGVNPGYRQPYGFPELVLQKNPEGLMDIELCNGSLLGWSASAGKFVIKQSPTSPPPSSSFQCPQPPPSH